MTQYEMTEKLSEKCNVTLEEARTALEAGDWNTLTATHLLEQEKFRRMQELNEFATTGAAAVQYAPEEPAAEEPAANEAPIIEQVTVNAETETAGPSKAKKHRGSRGLKNLGEHLRRLIAWGNRNRFEVRRGGETLLEAPVTALALGLVFAFWVCLPLMVVGLFAGCRYSFSGREFGREELGRALAGRA